MRRARVIIVGGGPAGVSTALFLSHSMPVLTDRILVLERERYPREKFCAGAIGARADRMLCRIGVTVEVPSVAIEGLALRAMGQTLEVREPGAGRVVRRFEFDHQLARIARARGITLLEGVRVSSVHAGSDGVALSTSQGEFRADVVVGADGVGSVVRRSVGFEKARYLAQALEVDTEPVGSDLDRELLLFDVSDRSLPGYYWDFPTCVGGRDLVCRGVYYLKTKQSKGSFEIQDVLERELARRGLELSSCKKKRFAELGFHRAVRTSRPRVLLTGEAAGIDPVTGEGIAQAIQYGELTGRYLAEKVEERDFGFSDYDERLKRSKVGRDLLVRTAALDLFYGPRRDRVERFLLDTPDFLRVGLQHFAGKRWSAGAVARGGWSVAKAAAAAWVGMTV